MFSVGRVCVKLAWRDSSKKCVIVEVLEKNIVLIDGETRRRKCNIAHLEPLKETMDVKSKASHADVVAAFKKIGIELKETKPKKAGEKPKQKRKVNQKVPVEKKANAKPAVKETPSDKSDKKEETASKTEAKE